MSEGICLICIGVDNKVYFICMKHLRSGIQPPAITTNPQGLVCVDKIWFQVESRHKQEHFEWGPVPHLAVRIQPGGDEVCFLQTHDLKSNESQSIWAWRISERQIHIFYSQLDQQLCNSKSPWGFGFDFPGLGPSSGTRWFLYLVSSLAKVSTRLAIILKEMLSLYLEKRFHTKFSVFWLIQILRLEVFAVRQSHPLWVEKKNNLFKSWVRS